MSVMAEAMAYDGKTRKIQSRRSATCCSSRSGILRMVTEMMVAMPVGGGMQGVRRGINSEKVSSKYISFIIWVLQFL